MPTSLLRPRPFPLRHRFTALLASSLLALSCSNDSESSTPTAGTGPVGSAGSGSAGEAGGGGSSGGVGGAMRTPWEWTGIIGTGQSLSVGEPDGVRGTAAAAARLTTQPFANQQLSTGSLPWPINSDDATLRLVPLVEPIGRPSTAYPSSWPTNIAGETHHSAMANQITALVQAAGGTDYVTIHSAVGENGQRLDLLKKGAVPEGVTGHAYEATLIETRAITRLAQAAGKTYGVGAITVTHGESDAGDATYATRLHQVLTDYIVDISAITGQAQPPLMIVSQQHSVGNTGRPPSTLEQWRIGLMYPGEVVCSGPKYQYPYTPDSIHLMVEGYELMGEKYAQIYFERVVLGHDWQPLQPTTAERSGRVVTVAFHVPVGPLAWETTFSEPHAGTPAWSAGKGFELRSGETPIGIASVEIVGDTVQITADADLPASGLTVGYAMSPDPVVTGTAPPAMTQPFVATFRWGLLRDSDPFVGYATQKPQPNYSVAFELPVP